MTECPSITQSGFSIDVTSDAFLGGAVSLMQPLKGHRAGIDAVLLAASLGAPGREPHTILDVGAGPGTVGILAGHRLSNSRVTLIEIENELGLVARKNAVQNNLDDRVEVLTGDVLEPFAQWEAMGLVSNSIDDVVSNPPFYLDCAARSSPNALKERANIMSREGFEKWIRFMTTMARADGRATLIYPAERMDELLALMERRFGGIEVFPVFPKKGVPANRVIIRGRKGSRALLTLHQGLIMHEDDGSFTAAARGILEEGRALDFTGQ